MALDPHQIIKKVYDSSNTLLKAQSAGPADSPQPTVYLSEHQIWKRVFDSSTNKLKTVQV